MKLVNDYRYPKCNNVNMFFVSCCKLKKITVYLYILFSKNTLKSVCRSWGVLLHPRKFSIKPFVAYKLPPAMSLSVGARF